MQKRVIYKKNDGATLLDFIASEWNLSKRKAKEIIDQRSVFVNRRRVWMARHALRTGDEVEIRTGVQEGQGLAAAPITILYQDKELVIADKPAGFLSNGPDSVETALRAALKRPALLAVHRLDRDTTGCLILASDESVKTRMIPLFRDRRITKVYHAIAMGEIKDGPLEIKRPIDGVEAVSRVDVISAQRAASHMRVRIETGRTHQIRQHLAAIRHPLLGDREYLRTALRDERYRKVPRQMLHASRLIFDHPSTGETIRAQAPLPPDFKQCLRVFGLK